MAGSCPECGAVWLDARTCQDDFHQMLFWEAERPALGEVHHLTVLCYHLQHPALYSPEGLIGAQGLLADFLERGSLPQDVRRREGARLSSDRRQFAITGRPGQHGAYAHPVAWTMRAGDVVAAGADRYLDSVQQWARSVYEALKESGNYPPG